MRYVWDPAKDALNQRKHGLSLADGIPALEDPEHLSWIDDRFDYGEDRIATLGMGRTNVLYVATTEPDEETTRIISVRRAELYEIKKYGLGRS
ncbi:MAG: BrnT family toxin [Terracidiphilus sp.]|jgi:uncharacterized DUF497 family protein